MTEILDLSPTECPECGSTLVGEEPFCYRRNCPKGFHGAGGDGLVRAPNRSTEAMLVREIYVASDMLARRLEVAAEDLRRRSLRMDFRNPSAFDVDSFIADQLGALRGMMGNLHTERLLHAGKDIRA